MPQNDEDGKPIIWMHVPLAYPYDPDYDYKFFPYELTSINDRHERALAMAQYELNTGLFSAKEIYEYMVSKIGAKFSIDYKE
jgi:hypothetical protein